MGCIKYSNDKNKLAAFIRGNPRIIMEVEAARVIETIARMGIEREEVDSMGNVNMCKAIEDMIEERACIEREEGKVEILIGLVKDGILNMQEAAKRMNMTTEEFRTKMK